MKPINHQLKKLLFLSGGLLSLSFAVSTGCSSGTTGGGSTAAPASQNPATPTAFVNNTADKTLSAVRLIGDSGSTVVSTLGAAGEFGNNALGDMTFSEGEWIFMNLAAGNGVALIDPLTAATPVVETILPTGERPVHLYRDPNDLEVVYIMNDANTLTGDDNVTALSVNCVTLFGPGAGGSVAIVHNSHLGPGGQVPHLIGKVCVRGKGHKVAAFSGSIAANAGIPKRAFVTSETSGEMAVIDDDEASPNYLTLLNRIDLCDSAKELAPCDADINTANASAPHGIRWSNFTGKVYSIQEGYGNFIEVDPTTLTITRKLDIPAPFTSFGMSPDGRFLIVRGIDKTDPTQVVGRLGLVDLNANPLVVTNLADVPQVQPGSFKFSTNGQKLFLTTSNTTTGLTAGQVATLKKDRLFVFSTAALPAAPPAAAEINLLAATSHSQDVLVQNGAGTYIVVSNNTDNSVSIVNANTNTVTQRVPVGNAPGGVMVYYPGAATSGNQATGSLTSGPSAQAEMLVMPVEPEVFGDRAMPE